MMLRYEIHKMKDFGDHIRSDILLEVYDNTCSYSLVMAHILH